MIFSLKTILSEEKFILSFKNCHFEKVLIFAKVSTVVIIVSAWLRTPVVYWRPKYLAEAKGFHYLALGFGRQSFILKVRSSKMD